MEGTVSSIETAATPEQLFAVATDLEAYPEWASAIREVEVLERDTEGRPLRARMVIEGFIKRISYVLRYTYDPPHSLRWTAEPGDDIKMMDGSYQFTPLDEGGTEVVYGLRVEPAFNVPGFLRKQAEKQIVGTALRELRRQAEARQDAASG